jgi:hypothetical protein
MTVPNFGREHTPCRLDQVLTRSARPQEHPKARGQSSREITYASEATVPPLAPLRQKTQLRAKYITREHNPSNKGRKARMELN